MKPLCFFTIPRLANRRYYTFLLLLIMPFGFSQATQQQFEVDSLLNNYFNDQPAVNYRSRAMGQPNIKKPRHSTSSKTDGAFFIP